MTRAGQRQTRLAAFEAAQATRHHHDDASSVVHGVQFRMAEDALLASSPRMGPPPAHYSADADLAPRASFSFLPAGDGIDESSLLAETEDLLATLDSSAFGRPGLSSMTTMTRSDTRATGAFNVAGPESMMTTMWMYRTGQTAMLPLRSAPAHSLDKTHAAPTTSRREEIQQLRKDAARLEVQLARLRYHNHSCLLVRDKRQHIWQELAVRQCRLRQLAEAENQQLKSMLHQVLCTNDPYQFEKHFGSKDALIENLPNYLQGPWRRAVISSPSQSAGLASLFEPLLQRLDAGLAELDAVFRENSLNQALTEPRSYAEKKTRRLGKACQYIELIDVRLSPFHWQAVGDATWHCNKAWYLKDNPFVYRCHDRPDDTFAVTYRIKHLSSNSGSGGGGGGGGGKQQSMGFTLAMRRYVQPDRVVFVCTNQIDGENELAGASTTDIGYLVISNVNVLSASDTSPVTVVRSCMQIFPQSDQNDTGLAKVNGLLNLMVGAFEEDVRFIRQEVDSLLLQQQASATVGNRSHVAVASSSSRSVALQKNGENQSFDAPRIAFRNSDLVRWDL